MTFSIIDEDLLEDLLEDLIEDRLEDKPLGEFPILTHVKVIYARLDILVIFLMISSYLIAPEVSKLQNFVD